MDLFALLPEELLELLITYLDGISTQRLGSTCSIFYHLTSQPKVWHRLLAITRVTAITREVDKLARGDPRAIYFLSHRLRRNWGSGVVREEEAWLPRGLYTTDHWFAASETCAARVNLVDPSQHSILQLFDLINGSGGQGLDFGGAVLQIPEFTDRHCGKDVNWISVLDSFIVVLRYGEPGLADMMVFSIQDQAFLYNQSVVRDLNSFVRGAHLDVTQFKDFIAGFQRQHITLYQVMREKIVVKELGVEENIHGVLRYCTFLAWDNTYMAHPFNAVLNPSEHDEHDAELEHRIYCWDQRTWERKAFKINDQVNAMANRHSIQHSLALHGGKLFAAQTSTVRIWDVELGLLEKVSTLDGILPRLFLITEGIGIHLHPATGLLVGVLKGCAIFSVVILNMEGELLSSLDIPFEKDKQLIETHLVGPRLVILYNDNSYSVVDLETLEASDELHDQELLTVFPLDCAHKKGTLASQRRLTTSTNPDTFYNRSFSNVSQFNIVTIHAIKPSKQFSSLIDHIQIFSFL